jgi:activator of HSP90 ATPase
LISINQNTMESFRIQATIHAKPYEIYNAWLDSQQHSEMTDSDAEIDPCINGVFSIWNGYITGSTVELEKGKKIVQRWRTTDFPAGRDHSVIEVHLLETQSGTKLKLSHFNIPDGQGKDYKEGWKEYYFKPMKRYFKDGK